MSLKVRLTLILSLLLGANAWYFYAGVGTIDHMDDIARTLYDRVVMSSTYSQMVKNDFHKYWLATSPADAAEAAQSLRDNLAVVRERALSAEDAAAVDAIAESFAKLERARGGRFAPVESTVARWLNQPTRLELLTKIGDLTDQIVAQGYDYRLNSVERATRLRRVSILGSIFILVLNALAFGFIVFSIMPRLRRLTEICVDIARGNFGKRVNFSGRDEFGELARSFNTMLEALRLSEVRVHLQLMTTNAMMDGLGQGFLMIGADGICQPVFSKACLDLLEASPAGRPAWRVLGVPETEAAHFADWLSLIFEGVSTFEALAALGPEGYPHASGRVIKLEYKPLRDETGRLLAVVVVATDRTAEVRARDEADREQEFSRMVVKLLRNRDEFTRFLIEARGMITRIAGAPPELGLRLLHTLKGGAATYSLISLKDAAHAWEPRLAAARDPAEAARAAALDLNARFEEILATLRDECAFTVNEAEVSRLVELGDVLRPFNEVVRDLARAQGKRVKPLVITGAALMIDRAHHADLLASLVHVFRNAVDHGLETPELRERLGKNGEATIYVDASSTADGGFTLRIRDDGRGVDVTKLRRVLSQRGVVVAGENDSAVLQHVFDAQLSTADRVTEVSGRGIGLEAVRAAARTLGGDAVIESVTDRGTTVMITVPGPKAMIAA